VAKIDDDQLIQQYLKDLDLRDATKKTIENYGSCIKIYKDWLKTKNLHIINVNTIDDKETIENFLYYLRKQRKTQTGKEISYSRIKVYFSALNNLYDFLEYNGYVKKNIILIVRKRYLKRYKNGYTPAIRKVIEVEEMSNFLNNIMNLKEKLMVLLFVKTGIRRSELVKIDISDIDLDEGMITLKEDIRKRSNRVVFFDDETNRILKKWINRRKLLANNGEKALFINEFGGRLEGNGVYNAITKWSKRQGLYDTKSNNLEDHFSTHNLRHCNTTYLLRSGMPREYIKELRGDKRAEIIDIYNHIDPKDLKRAYLSCIPKFDVY